MNLIRSSAYLHVCGRCKLHAYIVYTDGSSSLNFGSRETGLDIVEQNLKEKKLSPEEGCVVIEQIVASPLSIESDVVDMMLEGLRELNEAAGNADTEFFLRACREPTNSTHIC